jgi:hypothetical protein
MARPDRRQPGGCDFAEDPTLDARDADPAWLPDPDALIGVGPAVRDEDDTFSLWAIPGRKSIVHDGKRLLVKSRLGRRMVRLAVSLSLRDGQPYAFALPPGRRARERAAATVDLAEAIAGPPTPATAGGITRPMLVHMRTIHALDAKRAGASDREIAELVLGQTETDVSWNDSAARAQVRYLLRAGRRLRDGGYRTLLHPPGKEVSRT